MSNHMIWNRAKGEYLPECEPASGLVKALYETAFGRCLLKIVFARPWFSKLYALTMRTRSSAKRINPFIEKYGIDISNCEQKSFTFFEDFFMRKACPICLPEKGVLYAIAQAKLMAVKISEGCCLEIKGVRYTLSELLQNEALAQKYQGGVCLIYRLSLTDNHRYLFPDSGYCCAQNQIKGVLHTVRSVSENFRVFAHNARKWSVLHTEHFKDVLQMEIGAMLVGKTVETHGEGAFRALEEKGYFQYGGSSIVQCFEKDSITLDDDLWHFFCLGTEVQIQIGKKIGNAQKT